MDTCIQDGYSNYHGVDEAIKKLTNALLTEAKLSPQMNAKLTRLCEFPRLDISRRSLNDVVRCLTAIFNRFKLELVQAHFNTKQRVCHFHRLLNKKGCLLKPDLTISVIDELIRLYQSATENCLECSFTRKVLDLYVLKAVDRKYREKGTAEGVHLNHKYTKKDIAETVQTLYRSSCFDVDDGKLRLKSGIATVDDVRSQLDSEMIKLGLENHIRLNSESWSFILYGINQYQDNIPQIQSFLDKLETPVSMEELRYAVESREYIYVSRIELSRLEDIQRELNQLNQNSIGPDVDRLVNLIRKFSQPDLRRLFVLRQSRNVKEQQNL